MKKVLHSIGFGFGFFMFLFISPQRIQATLGGYPDSIESDQRALSAVQRNSTIHSKYTVYEISSNATKVREYVSGTGIVFGVAWNGLIHPDLTILLGSFAGEYSKAVMQAPRIHGRRYSKLKTQHVVVEKWGHMRNLQGRAYVPSLIPAGVYIDDIK